MALQVVVFGVMGSGKSTVGEALARSLGWPFEDADDHHPASSLAKLRRGEALTDADRAPWLDRLAGLLREAHEAERSVVLACSALKAAYRARLRVAKSVRFVFLHGDRATLQRLLEGREGHFADPTLLESQLQELEEPAPDEALRVEIDQPLDAKVRTLRDAFGEG
ncbi:MAG: gluconokinase [Sandaracinaceae bacterium]